MSDLIDNELFCSTREKIAKTLAKHSYLSWPEVFELIRQADSIDDTIRAINESAKRVMSPHIMLGRIQRERNWKRIGAERSFRRRRR